MFFFSCSCSKKSNTTNNPAGRVSSDSIPLCINNLIDSFKMENIQNPPRKVYSYTYKSNTVFYIPSICCDQYSTLYDDNCNIIGHPDGGFSGRGDGSIPDFFTVSTNETLIWKDDR